MQPLMMTGSPGLVWQKIQESVIINGCKINYVHTCNNVIDDIQTYYGNTRKGPHISSRQCPFSYLLNKGHIALYTSRLI